MPSRGLILGSLAFAAAYGAERLFASMSKDIARYDSMRAMSGEQSLVKQVVSSLGGAIGDLGFSEKQEAGGLIASLTADVVRYAKMKGM